MTFDRFRRWPRTPLSALIAGPTAGGPWNADSSHMPRSVTEKYFDKVCPPSERRLINTKDVKPAINEASGIVIFETWQRLLLNAPEQCIEIEAAPWPAESYPQTFDLYLWGSERILSLWDSFSKSPTSRLLATSPLVNSAVARNEHLFGAVTRMTDDAMHVRRGDFKGACLELARWNSTFYSWNLLPFLPDKFTPPPGGSWGSNTPRTPLYTRAVSSVVRGHCRESTRGVVDAMKHLLKNDGWRTVVTSRDLALNDEQAVVGMAVDMDIARRAACSLGMGGLPLRAISSTGGWWMGRSPSASGSGDAVPAMNERRRYLSLDRTYMSSLAHTWNVAQQSVKNNSAPGRGTRWLAPS
ncbi:Myosin [Salix suchowensis]|nr:Myosin [Salix suchowensis]